MARAKKNWEATEKIVAVLEKFLSPNSKVQHNVNLPVLGKPEREPRQFDVVITTDLSPNRKHIVVIEVQDRNTKPDILTFQGWIAKMREVGANQLICVSEIGFPDSIIVEVEKTYGENVVTLMTLKQFDKLINPQNVNIDLSFDLRNKNYKYEDFKLPRLEDSAMKYMPFEFKETDKIFLFDNSNKKQSFDQIVREIIYTESNKSEFIREQKTKNSCKIYVNIDKDTGLYALINDQKFLITEWIFTIVLTITNISYEADTKKYVYRQEIINNSIAWISSTVLKYHGKTAQIDFVATSVNGKIEYKIIDSLLEA